MCEVLLLDLFPFESVAGEHADVPLKALDKFFATGARVRGGLHEAELAPLGGQHHVGGLPRISIPHAEAALVVEGLDIRHLALALPAPEEEELLAGVEGHEHGPLLLHLETSLLALHDVPETDQIYTHPSFDFEQCDIYLKSTVKVTNFWSYLMSKV